MSGIYIPGMEMPETCCDCRFAVDGWCYAAEKQDNKQYLNDTQRANWCPLVPVPDHNCERCGHLNMHGRCNMTACIYPVIETTTIVSPQIKP